MQKRSFILLFTLSLVFAGMFFVSAGCTGTPTVNCAAQPESGWWGCGNSPLPVCGDTSCHEQDYYEDTVEVCDCSLVGDCEDLDFSECSTISGCSWSGTSPVCGDGVIGSGEACDDGDAISGDGCSSTCQVEGEYTCSNTPSVCVIGINPLWLGYEDGDLVSFSEDNSFQSAKVWFLYF